MIYLYTHFSWSHKSSIITSQTKNKTITIILLNDLNPLVIKSPLDINKRQKIKTNLQTQSLNISENKIRNRLYYCTNIKIKLTLPTILTFSRDHISVHRHFRKMWVVPFDSARKTESNRIGFFILKWVLHKSILFLNYMYNRLFF